MILLGDAAQVLKDFNHECIDCVVTSPPYWALRDYETDGQLGIESTFDDYIKKLVDIFKEIKRVLMKAGTCWIVLGDSYSSMGGLSKPEHLAKANVGATKNGIQRGMRYFVDRTKIRVPEKSLMMIPERFAIAMIEQGWILRNKIIWHKPNAIPNAVNDRFTNDWEYVYFFTKSQRYSFNLQYDKTGIKDQRIMRSFWSLPVESLGEHIAAYPEELVERCILSGTKEGDLILDPFAGSGTTLKAAHQLNRKWIGIEINPEYVALAKKRLTPYIQQQRLETFLSQ